MSRVEFVMSKSILQPKVDGKVLPVKLDTQQITAARRAGHLTQFIKDGILKKLHKDLRDTPGLTTPQISTIMTRFMEELE